MQGPTRLIVVLSLMFMFFLSITVITRAEGESTPDVAADFKITFRSGTELLINVTIDVKSITTDATYTNEDIKKMQDPYAIGAIEYALYLDLRDQIKGMFANDDILNFTRPRYINERFRESLNVKLSPSFFKLNNSVDVNAFINGMLDVDAVVVYPFDFQASPGWNNTFQVILPEGMMFRNTTGRVNDRVIVWELYNHDGKHPNLKGWLSLQYTKPTTPKSMNEDVTLDFILDTSSIQKNKLDVMINVHSLDVSSYNILPSSISNVGVVPSDCVRLLVDNNLLSWSSIYQKSIKPLEEKIHSTLESSSLNQSITLYFRWDQSTTTNCSDPYNTRSMDNKPPIKALLTDDDVDVRFMGITARGFYGLINAGAFADIKPDDLNFGDNLPSLGYPYTCKLILPEGVYLNNKKTYEWSETDNLTGSFTSDKAPTYNKEDKQVSVDLYFTKMDLNIQSIIVGKKELTTPIQARETTEIRVTKLPEALQIPENIYITHLNSDALRLCVEEHIFTDAQVESFLRSYTQLFENRISGLLPGVRITGYPDRVVFNESLKWDGDISKMDGQNPVKVASFSNTIYNMPFNLSIWPPSFSMPEYTFTLYGLEDGSITYRITYPLGVTIKVNDTKNKNIIIDENENGEQYLQVSFKANEYLDGYELKCRLEASSIFILGMFLPCIISIILLVVLIIVLVLISRRRRGGLLRLKPSKKRREKKIKEKPSDETEEVEEEEEAPEYYVPPPPTRRL